MENDFRKKEINPKKKMKEINAAITKKQIVETTGKTFKRGIIRNRNFLCGSFPPYEGVKTSEVRRKFGVQIREIKVAEN